jgi:hypothetical protein
MCSHANDVTVIGFFVTDEDSAYENFIAAGEELREEYKNYVYTTDPSIIKGLQAQPNTVRVCIPDKWTSKHEPSFREMKIVSRRPLRAHTHVCRRVLIVRILYLSCKRAVHPWLDIERERIYHASPSGHWSSSIIQLISVWNTSKVCACRTYHTRPGTQYWRNKVLTVAARWTAMTNYKFAVSDEEEFQDELIAAGIGDSGMEVCACAGPPT